MKRDGFTLLEVMIALVIFAMTAVVLGAAYLNVLISYQQAGRGNGDDLDLGYARQLLMAQPDLPTAQAGDKFETPDGNLVSWTADIEPTTTADLFSVALTCEVTPSGQGASRKFIQNFMLLRPTWSQPTDRTKLRQDAATRIAVAQGKKPQ